jgi:hypothetical protein
MGLSAVLGVLPSKLRVFSKIVIRYPLIVNRGVSVGVPDNYRDAETQKREVSTWIEIRKLAFLCVFLRAFLLRFLCD